MIHISTRRAGLICLAATVNDHLDVFTSWGLTQEGASRRLLRRQIKAAS
jgi:hypothetical protein